MTVGDAASRNGAKVRQARSSKTNSLSLSIKQEKQNSEDVRDESHTMGVVLSLVLLVNRAHVFGEVRGLLECFVAQLAAKPPVVVMHVGYVPLQPIAETEALTASRLLTNLVLLLEMYSTDMLIEITCASRQRRHIL